MDIISKSLDSLGLNKESCNYKVLDFFDENKDRNNIREFLNPLSLKIQEQKDDKTALLKLFNDLNGQNWQEIDHLSGQENSYAIFLRLKSFLLTVDFGADIKEDLEWLEVFKEKFISYPTY